MGANTFKEKYLWKKIVEEIFVRDRTKQEGGCGKK